MLIYVYIYISEVNDGSYTKDGRKELGLFCYCKMFVIFM